MWKLLLLTHNTVYSHVLVCLLTAVYLDKTHLILIMSVLPPASLYDPSSVILSDISKLPVSSLHLSSTLSSLWVSVPVWTRGGTVSRRGWAFPRWWRSVSYRTTSTTEWRWSPVSWGWSVTWRNNNTHPPAATLLSQEKKAQGIDIQPTNTYHRHDIFVNLITSGEQPYYGVLTVLT